MTSDWLDELDELEKKGSQLVVKWTDARIYPDEFSPLFFNHARELIDAAKGLDKLRKVLKTAEWCEQWLDDANKGFCPVCGSHQINAHKPDCELAEALK